MPREQQMEVLERFALGDPFNGRAILCWLFPRVFGCVPAGITGRRFPEDKAHASDSISYCAGLASRQSHFPMVTVPPLATSFTGFERVGVSG